jgi:hypothetical protein
MRALHAPCSRPGDPKCARMRFYQTRNWLICVDYYLYFYFFFYFPDSSKIENHLPSAGERLIF